ncbi:MAG: hypothetical protein ACFB00_05565 [Parvularculaceae bacterium]
MQSAAEIEITEPFQCGASEKTIVGKTPDRRRVRRVLDVWACSARGGFPSWRDVRTADLHSDWPWIFVVDADATEPAPTFTFLGARLEAMTRGPLLAGALGATALDRLIEHVNVSIALEGPNVCEDNIRLSDGRSVSFRCFTAPLADDGRSIDRVLGCVSGRLGGRWRRAP